MKYLSLPTKSLASIRPSRIFDRKINIYANVYRNAYITFRVLFRLLRCATATHTHNTPHNVAQTHAAYTIHNHLLIAYTAKSLHISLARFNTTRKQANEQASERERERLREKDRNKQCFVYLFNIKSSLSVYFWQQRVQSLCKLHTFPLNYISQIRVHKVEAKNLFIPLPPTLNYEKYLRGVTL